MLSPFLPHQTGSDWLFPHTSGDTAALDLVLVYLTGSSPPSISATPRSEAEPSHKIASIVCSRCRRTGRSSHMLSSLEGGNSVVWFRAHECLLPMLWLAAYA